jgi:hypothetical protein
MSDGKEIANEPDAIARSILLIRGQRVMLDTDLAALYGVAAKVLLQAVKRNSVRFPIDFMFQLSNQEVAHLRSQFVTSRHGGRRYAPYAFTEQGVAMLSSVLRSPRAVLVNVEIMRTFVRLRQMLGSNVELARKVAFDAIRELMAPTAPKKTRRVGFAPWDPES